jgi:hypothetical protein
MMRRETQRERVDRRPTCRDRKNNAECGQTRNSSTGSHKTNYSNLVLCKCLASLLIEKVAHIGAAARCAALGGR